MPERDIISGSRGELVVTDQPRWPQTDGAIGNRHIVPVRHRDLPSRGALAGSLERDHIAVVAVRTAPNLETELAKCNRLVMSDPEHAQVRQLGQGAVMKDCVGNGRGPLAT